MKNGDLRTILFIIQERYKYMLICFKTSSWVHCFFFFFLINKNNIFVLRFQWKVLNGSEGIKHIQSADWYYC